MNGIIENIDKSPTLVSYKDTMKDIIKVYLGNDYNEQEIDDILNYSIDKRLYSPECKVENNYTNKTYEMTILKMADYIAKKQPIVTAQGTMFMRHADCPNPMADVLQQFLDLRSKYKKQMFSFPRGSEEFEKYNLLQQLSKIDANGIG